MSLKDILDQLDALTNDPNGDVGDGAQSYYAEEALRAVADRFRTPYTRIKGPPSGEFTEIVVHSEPQSVPQVALEFKEAKTADWTVYSTFHSSIDAERFLAELIRDRPDFLMIPWRVRVTNYRAIGIEIRNR